MKKQFQQLQQAVKNRLLNGEFDTVQVWRDFAFCHVDDLEFCFYVKRNEVQLFQSIQRPNPIHFDLTTEESRIIFNQFKMKL